MINTVKSFRYVHKTWIALRHIKLDKQTGELCWYLVGVSDKQRVRDTEAHNTQHSSQSACLLSQALAGTQSAGGATRSGMTQSVLLRDWSVRLSWARLILSPLCFRPILWVQVQRFSTVSSETEIFRNNKRN